VHRQRNCYCSANYSCTGYIHARGMWRSHAIDSTQADHCFKTSGLSYTTSASIVLFVALVEEQPDSRYSKTEIEDHLRNLRSYVSDIYNETTSPASSNPIGEQYLRLLDTLLIFSYQRLNLRGQERLSGILGLFRQVKTFMQFGRTSSKAPHQQPTTSAISCYAPS